MPLDPHSSTPGFINPEKILTQLPLEEGQTIADLGCGSGYYSFSASKIVGEEGKVYAVDIQKAVLSALQSEIERNGHSNISPVWADIEVPGSTKIPDGSVDVVLLAAVLYQTKKHAEIITAAKKMLKDRGQILIIDWKETNVPMGPQSELRVSAAKIKEEAATAGLKLKKEIKVDPYHYGLIFEK